MRYGDFEIHGIKGTFPRQAITSTNLNHAKLFEDPYFDFKTNIVEIVEFQPKKLVNNSEYREKRRKIVSEMIEANQNKLCLFTIKGARGTSFKPNRENNESLINFQIDCGFTLIKVFFRYVRNAVENSRYYRSIIPKGKSFVAELDENLNHFTFRNLYLECYRNNDEIIAFFGRKPRKSDSKQIHNRLNFAFISARKDDKILRLTSFASKSINGAVSSLIYNISGFDVYSFLTRRGSPNIPDYELNALNGFLYEPLTEDTTLICPITGKSLYDSSKEFEEKLDKSSLPVSVHDIVRLNELLDVLHENYTREQLLEILGNRIP